MAPGRSSLPVQLAAGLAVLGAYVPTLYRSVPGGDSGELIVAAYRLGVAHPPGYPLFTMLGKLATLLPFGSVAWRVNFLTALFAAAAAAVLLGATWKLTRSLAAGLLAGGLFATSPLVWRYAIGAEVFSLNNLFVSALVALLVEYEQRPAQRTLCAYFLVFGLGLTNHQTLLFVGAPMGAWMLYRARKPRLQPRRLLQVAACGGAGLLPYLYLFLSRSTDPASTWRRVAGISDFLEHVTRAQYGTFRLGATDRGSDLMQNLAAYSAHLPAQMLFVAVVLPPLALGLVLPGRSRLDGVQTVVTRVVLGAWAVYLVGFHAMANLPLDQPLFREIQSRFWQQADLLLFLLAGVAFAWLARRLTPAIAIVVAASLVVVQGALTYGREDQSGNRLISDFAEQTLARFPPNALVLSKGDLYWNSLRYKQVCEGLRTDVRLLDLETLKAPWMADLVRRGYEGVGIPGRVYRSPDRAGPGSYDLEALIDANFARFPVLSNALDGADASWKEHYVAWPEGVYDRIRDPAEPVDLDAYLAGEEAATDLTLPDNARDGSWEQVARRHRVAARARVGTHALQRITSGELDPRYRRRAGGLIESAVASGEPFPAAVHLTLGYYYLLEREQDPAVVPKMVREWNRFLELAPRDDPRREMVRRVLADPERARLEGR